MKHPYVWRRAPSALCALLARRASLYAPPPLPTKVDSKLLEKVYGACELVSQYPYAGASEPPVLMHRTLVHYVPLCAIGSESVPALELRSQEQRQKTYKSLDHYFTRQTTIHCTISIIKYRYKTTSTIYKNMLESNMYERQSN